MKWHVEAWFGMASCGPWLHSVVVSYNRMELTKQAIDTYIETVSVPFSLTVVDNASDEATAEWLINHSKECGYDVILLPVNRFPGYATNRGWEKMPEQTTHLHRGDNDFAYLPGWCEEMLRRFKKGIGQVGLRTGKEELKARSNVGGNNVILRRLWDEGLRYDERPWGEQYPPGWTEDSLFSPEIKRRGWDWVRVKRPCIQSLSREDPTDSYYQETWAIRGIVPPSA